MIRCNSRYLLIGWICVALGIIAAAVLVLITE